MATQNNKGNVIISQPSLRGGTTKQSHDINDNNKQIASSLEMTHARVPKLRFKEFEGQWEERKLGDISAFSKGKSISKSDIDENGILECIRYGELYTVYDEVIFDIKSKTNLNADDLVLSESNDVIIPASGETQIDIATASCVLKDGIALGGDLNIIKSKTNGVFLSYYLNSKKKIDIARLSQGISVVHLYSSQLKTLNLNLPQDEEQQKIANFLTAVDTKLQQLTTKKEKLALYKKGVMQQLFSQQLRFKPDVIANAVKQSHEAISPNETQFPDWEFPHANVLFKSVSDKKHNSDLPILAITQDQGAIPRELIDYNMIVSDKSVASYKVVQVGDFIISLRSFQGGIEYSNYKGICSPAYNILRPTSEKVNKEFYKRYLKTDKYIRQLQSKLEGIRDGKMISFKYFSEIKLPFPCFEEQQKIANYLSAIDKKIEAVQTQITQTQAFKKGLLQQMFV
ncbi:restriction modification system DNA specificity domain [Cellulophaga geojensis KL-A]|uniref:Restriction modification system DNA specificity domain n=1 Tax=Cellulophaga geojensis KL-A TaxID=1328323 RepID=A0ABP3B469_9FLAO|nr:restriction endonuclease subunit S [Cellulophaga geojensis]EWH12638.1 restriction modification system DNA specificity domain [Cellulophaga geojensis KL-A]